VLCSACVLGNAGTCFLWVQPASPGMAEPAAQERSPPSTSLSPAHRTHPAEPPASLPAGRRPQHPSQGPQPRPGTLSQPTCTMGTVLLGQGTRAAGLHHPAAVALRLGSLLWNGSGGIGVPGQRPCPGGNGVSGGNGTGASQ